MSLGGPYEGHTDVLNSDLASLETEGSQHNGSRWTGIYYESTYTLLCF